MLWVFSLFFIVDGCIFCLHGLALSMKRSANCGSLTDARCKPYSGPSQLLRLLRFFTRSRLRLTSSYRFFSGCIILFARPEAISVKPPSYLNHALLMGSGRVSSAQVLDLSSRHAPPEVWFFRAAAYVAHGDRKFRVHCVLTPLPLLRRGHLG